MGQDEISSKCARGRILAVKPWRAQGQADPGDARATFASLSKAGRRLLTDALASAQQISAECVQAVPGGQADALHGTHSRLAGINSSNS